jgi:hypothetical protein
VSWVINALLEGAVFRVPLASIATMEFRPSRRKPFRLTALALARLVFGLLAFGETVTEQHESVANLYAYFAATVILIVSSGRCRPIPSAPGSNEPVGSAGCVRSWLSCESAARRGKMPAQRFHGCRGSSAE